MIDKLFCQGCRRCWYLNPDETMTCIFPVACNQFFWEECIELETGLEHCIFLCILLIKDDDLAWVFRFMYQRCGSACKLKKFSSSQCLCTINGHDYVQTIIPATRSGSTHAWLKSWMRTGFFFNQDEIRSSKLIATIYIFSSVLRARRTAYIK